MNISLKKQFHRHELEETPIQFSKDENLIWSTPVVASVSAVRRDNPGLRGRVEWRQRMTRGIELSLASEHRGASTWNPWLPRTLPVSFARASLSLLHPFVELTRTRKRWEFWKIIERARWQKIVLHLSRALEMKWVSLLLRLKVAIYERKWEKYCDNFFSYYTYKSLLP